MEETCAAYTRDICEFFNFVGDVHPKEVAPAHVSNYRDHLRINKRRKANSVATKLTIVRSVFEYLKAGGITALNPASTKLVTPPELPTEPWGRALSPKEVRYERTIQGVEAINTMRKEQVKRLDRGDAPCQASFVASLFQVAA